MEQQQIFGPFFAMMALTLAVWTFMYWRRIRFINGLTLEPGELAIPGRLAELSPPSVSNPSDNLKNLFEMPVLFYAIVLYLFATQTVDAAHVAAAWIFVSLRALHSAVHCTLNHVMTRFWLYAISSVALWIMMVRAATGWLAR